MNNRPIKIDYDNKFNLSVFKDSRLKFLLNNNNIQTLKYLCMFKNLYNNGWFEVPFIENKLSWGHERLFIPFTNKLFKILENDINDTSLQLHPLKTERWLSLSDKSFLEDEFGLKKFQYLSYIEVPKNTIHLLKKNSLVFEEQDNNLFDNNETIRIYDKLGRKINDEKDYYKQLLPQYRGKIKKLNINSELNNIPGGRKDKFIFIIKGKVEIKYNEKKYILNKEKSLFFICSNCEIISIDGISRIVNCKYYKVINNA